LTAPRPSKARGAKTRPGRGRWTQVLRVSIQLSVVLFIVYGALGGPWRNFKVAHNLARLVGMMEGPVWGTLYAYNENLLSLFGEPYRASFNMLGLPWSGTVAGVVTADPLMVAGYAVRNGMPPTNMLLAVITPLLLALLAGRLFCSHICPARFMFQLGRLIRGGLLYMGIPLPHLRSPVRLGGWVLLGGLLATAGAGIIVWHFILPYVGWATGTFLAITSGTAAGLLTVPAILLTIDVLIAPGEFCRTACPTGWLLEQVGRRSIVRLRRPEDPACPEGCQSCIRACPYRLSPRDAVTRADLGGCDSCGLCVTACPDRKLYRLPGLRGNP
jgi:ferredoxin-type protein NapH